MKTITIFLCLLFFFSAETILSQKLTILYPSQPDTFYACSSIPIQWQGRYHYGTYDIYYSPDSGSTWTPIIEKLTISNSSGVYIQSRNVTLPAITSDKAMLRIFDRLSNSHDTTDFIFTTINPLKLTSPIGGESLIAHDTLSIQWEANSSISKVNLQFSTDSAKTWQSIAKNILNTGKYRWSLANQSSHKYFIKIDNDCISDKNDIPFSVTGFPQIEVVTYPNGQGGIGYYNKLPLSIRFKTYNLPSETIDISYSENAGATWLPVVINTSKNKDYYYWTIPNVITNKFLFRINDHHFPEIVGISDTISIINSEIETFSPREDSVYENCTHIPITFSGQGRNTNYDVNYSTDNGISWNSIASNKAAVYFIGESIKWKLPDFKDGQCLLAITDRHRPTISDTLKVSISNNNAPHLKLTSFKEPRSLTTSNEETITWESSPEIRYVQIWYSTDNGINYNQSASGPSTDGHYVWQVPDISGSDILIKITDSGNECRQDTSDHRISITQIPYIEFVKTNTTEYFTNRAASISWRTGKLNSAHSKLEYSDDDGASWYLIKDSLQNEPEQGRFRWPLDTVPTGNYLLKLSDLEDPSVYTIRMDPFKVIDPYIRIISPTPGEIISNCSSYFMRWEGFSTSNEYMVLLSENNGITWDTLRKNIYFTSSMLFNYNIKGRYGKYCILKVIDTKNPSYYSISQPFSITGDFLSINHPKGNEQWQPETQQEISWNTNADFVDLMYSTDGGKNWDTIVERYTGINRYNWRTPETNSSKYRIKINKSGSNCPADTSENFTIQYKSRIAFTSPKQGDFLYNHISSTISWATQYLTGELELFFSPDSGKTWSKLNPIERGTNSTIQTLPKVISTKCLLKLVSVNDPSILCISPLFSVNGPELTITNHKNGETISACSQRSINYRYASTVYNSSARITFQVHKDSNLLINELHRYQSKNGSSSYSFTIPEVECDSCILIIRDIMADQARDTLIFPVRIKKTSSPLSILSPNGGETLLSGMKFPIKLTALKDETILLQVSYNSGSTWSTIARVNPGDSIYNWTVPDIATMQATLKATIPNTCVYNQSKSPFTIKKVPYINVYGIEKNIVIPAKSNKLISFSHGNLSGASLKAVLVNPYGPNYTLASGISPSSNQVKLIMPDTECINCHIAISDMTSSATGVTESFSIKKAKLSITYPTKDTKVTSCTDLKIQWESENLNHRKSIYYSANGDNSWQKIGSSFSKQFIWRPPVTFTGKYMIKVEDEKHTELFTVSDTFSIIKDPMKNIIISYPDSGEVKKSGDTLSVKWASTGPIPFVNLQLSVDAGKYWSTRASNINNSGEYTIPLNTQGEGTDSALIRIQEHNGCTYDVSNHFFTITQSPFINVTYPYHRALVEIGESVHIQWYANNIDPNSKLRFDYSLDGGVNWQLITDSITSQSGDRSYTWDVPTVISDNMVIRITSAEHNLTAFSDAFRSTYGGIFFINPYPGETLYACTDNLISWESTLDYHDLTLQYSIDEGLSWQLIPNINFQSPGYYNWNPPQVNSNNCLLKLTGWRRQNKIEHTTGYTFSIKNTPSSTIRFTQFDTTQNYRSGEKISINWISDADVNRVSLEYAHSTDQHWHPIERNMENSGTHHWTTPGISGYFKLRIRNADGCGEAVSGTFKIDTANYISLLAPKGGEIWAPGTMKYIKYQSNNIPENLLTIAYSTDNGLTWIENEAEIQNQTEIPFLVPDIKDNNNIIIKLFSPVNHSIADISGPIIISENKEESRVITPNSISVVQPNSTYPILWDASHLSGDNVILEYTVDGTKWINIASNNELKIPVPNNGKFNWLITQELNSEIAQIRIKEETTNQIIISEYFTIGNGVVTNATQNISSSSTVIYPNPAKDWITISTHNIPNGYYFIRLYSTTGVMLYNQEVIIENNQPLRIIIDELKSGMYYLSIPNSEIKGQTFMKTD